MERSCPLGAVPAGEAVFAAVAFTWSFGCVCYVVKPRAVRRVGFGFGKESGPRRWVGRGGAGELSKRLKSIWWMPRCREAKKDVALCDKPRGDESDL